MNWPLTHAAQCLLKARMLSQPLTSFNQMKSPGMLCSIQLQLGIQICFSTVFSMVDQEFKISCHLGLFCLVFDSCVQHWSSNGGNSMNSLKLNQSHEGMLQHYPKTCEILAGYLQVLWTLITSKVMKLARLQSNAVLDIPYLNASPCACPCKLLRLVCFC
jgi:hypothetical protein